MRHAGHCNRRKLRGIRRTPKQAQHAGRETRARKQHKQQRVLAQGGRLKAKAARASSPPGEGCNGGAARTFWNRPLDAGSSSSQVDHHPWAALSQWPLRMIRAWSDCAGCAAARARAMAWARRIAPASSSSEELMDSSPDRTRYKRPATAAAACRISLRPALHYIGLKKLKNEFPISKVVNDRRIAPVIYHRR